MWMTCIVATVAKAVRPRDFTAMSRGRSVFNAMPIIPASRATSVWRGNVLNADHWGCAGRIVCSALTKHLSVMANSVSVKQIRVGLHRSVKVERVSNAASTTHSIAVRSAQSVANRRPIATRGSVHSVIRMMPVVPIVSSVADRPLIVVRTGLVVSPVLRTLIVVPVSSASNSSVSQTVWPRGVTTTLARMEKSVLTQRS